MKLQDSRLFKDTNINTSLIKTHEFPNNYTIELEGDVSTYIGIVLEGQIDVKAYSLAGKSFTISTLTPGMIFGDVLMFGKMSNVYPGNLVTKGSTTIAHIPNNDVKHYLNSDNVFMQNFLSVLSDKVYNINTKSKLLSQDSIRDKILYYLHQEIRIQGSNRIQLNMSKEDLANILFIQRPSLSRELIKMRNEGLIEFDRWTITLKVKKGD